MIRFALMDCGHKVAVAIKVGRRYRAWRFRNPFRINLSNEDWIAGKPKWRWPVSLWAER